MSNRMIDLSDADLIAIPRGSPMSVVCERCKTVIEENFPFGLQDINYSCIFSSSRTRDVLVDRRGMIVRGTCVLSPDCLVVLKHDPATHKPPEEMFPDIQQVQ